MPDLFPFSAPLFSEFLSFSKGKKFVICTHIKADTDAVASAYALHMALPDSTVAVPDELSETGKALCEHLGFFPKELPKLKPKDYDGVIVVDSSAKAMLAGIERWDVSAIFDHHQTDAKDISAPYEFVFPGTPSTSEIIGSLLFDRLTPESAFALAAGIIADTARFKGGTNGTLGTLHRLLQKSGKEYMDALKIGEPQKPADSRIAILKGLSGVRFMLIEDYMVAYSEAGTNESDTAQILSDIADIALVASWKNKDRQTRISARVNKFCDVEMNRVMNEAGKSLGGEGGGHFKAAGCSSMRHPEESLEVCLDVLKDYIAEKKAMR
ncbi:MAG: DHH family phosphoesterase [Candidatus Bilamarchaeaceae archaeon]